jgi:hypothetical protein
MMNLKIAHRATALTAPTIPSQNRFMQYSIGLLIQLEPRVFGADRVHEGIRTFLFFGPRKGIE